MLFRDFLTLVLLDNQEIVVRMYCSDCAGEYFTKRELMEQERFLDYHVKYFDVMLGCLLLVSLEFK